MTRPTHEREAVSHDDRIAAGRARRDAVPLDALSVSGDRPDPARVQLCGDAHLSNFGLFKGPDRRLVFDLNDFDETTPGPFEWDLKRLAASVTIAGRNNELSGKEIGSATRASVRGYREVLARTTEMSPLGWSRYRRADGGFVDFYFRQLWDGKGSADVDQMGPKRLKDYARHCGAALALAHACTGDAAMISSYLGDDKAADRAFAEFAERYADLNERDHAAHEAAIETGRVEATGEF